MPYIPEVTSRCGRFPQCGASGHVDYGYAVFGLIIDNIAASQTVFYQVNLGDTRDATGCKNHLEACSTSHMRWYASSNPFGATDTPATLGYPCLKMSRESSGVLNASVTYSFDVLPRLKLLLQQGPAALDQNLTRWQATGTYIGLGMQGSVKQSMIVHHIDLRYT